jgi:hypothetical protein
MQTFKIKNQEVIKRLPMYFLVLLISMASCKKSSEDVTYYIGNILSARTTRLYDKHGEIADKSIVDRFSKTYGNFDPNMNIMLMTYKFSATYLNASTVVVKSLVTLNSDTMSVIMKDGIIVWESRDTSNYFTINNDAFKYQRIHFLEVNHNGLIMITKYLDCIYLKPSGDDLIMPITYYYHKWGDSFSSGSSSSNGINDFNSDYISGFGDTDTVLVYEYSLRMQAQ